MMKTFIPNYWLLPGTSRFIIMKNDQDYTKSVYAFNNLDDALRVLEDCNALSHLESIEYAFPF